MGIFSRKLKFKENKKIVYFKVPEKLFNSDNLSQVCQLTGYNVFYINIYSVKKKEVEKLYLDLLVVCESVIVNNNDLVIESKTSQIKDILDTLANYNYGELGIWDSIDEPTNSVSKFWLSYWLVENNYFELYMTPDTKNLEQIKKIFM